MTAVPLDLVVAGRPWTVERVWPIAADGSRPVEVRSGDDVRGGRWTPDAGVTLLGADEDRRLPALSALADRGTIVSHRPGKRAVVRLADGSGFAKIVPRGKARRVIDGHDRGAAFADHLRVPSVVPSSTDERGDADVVLFSTLDGRTLAAIGEDPSTTDVEWVHLWDEWAERWPLAVVDGASTTDLPTHTASDEAAILRTWAGHAAAAGSPRARRLDRLARALGDELERLPAVAPVLAHRDLHDKQLLWDADGGLGLLDLDTSTRADPALDLGNLAAHADLAAHQGRWTTGRAAVATAAVSRAATTLGVTPVHVDAWRRAARFRVACVHLLRPRWSVLAQRDLDLLLDSTDHRPNDGTTHA